MTELFERGLVVSPPARDLPAPPASVFALDALAGASLPPALSAALALLGACAPPGRPRLVAPRPEMFAEGETRAWFDRALGGVADHVALSDGETVRLVPGLRNHVFFYNLGEPGRLEALERLERRAPELLTLPTSQINTALRFRCRGRRHAPPTLALVGAAAEGAPDLRQLRFDGAASAAKTLAGEPVEPAGFARLDYLRLSAAALTQGPLARRVAAWIGDVLCDPSRALVWALPPGFETMAERLDAVVRCVRAGGRPPGGMMANVFFATGDLDPQALARLAPRRTLVTDDLADLAAAPPEGFERVLVHARPGRHMPGQFHDLLRGVYGPQVEIDWLRPETSR